MTPPAPAPLLLRDDLFRKIEAEGVASFPEECCGIMIGVDGAPGRVVEELLPVRNDFDDTEKYHRFSIDPAQLMKVDREVGARGKSVLGFYHSHPDHPAKPSEYDRTHAWPYYSYVIVSIMARKPADMTCWVLDETTEQFVEQPIRRGK